MVDWYMRIIVDFDPQRKFSTPEECPGAIPDTVNNAQYIRELYFKVDPNYSGRFTVPVLWDKKTGTIGKLYLGWIKEQAIESSPPSSLFV